jgi:hypothetical protein
MDGAKIGYNGAMSISGQSDSRSLSVEVDEMVERLHSSIREKEAMPQHQELIDDIRAGRPISI